jgi:hypothetical protein
MICGAEACNLGAMIHGAELRVHFLKSFQKRPTCENLSNKGLKSKKKKNGCADPIRILDGQSQARSARWCGSHSAGTRPCFGQAAWATGRFWKAKYSGLCGISFSLLDQKTW